MRLSNQQKKMKEIFDLLSQDLGYIYGERKSGPNGAKKEFLRKSSAFLRQLSKDLGFKDTEVRTNPGGIALSGEVSLYGMWGENNGLFFEINQPFDFMGSLLYREINSLKDYKGGANLWLPVSVFKDMDYELLCDTFLAFKRREAGKNVA